MEENINYSAETMRIVQESLDNEVPVVIHYNNETGDWCYAVALQSDPAFWLNAFGTKKAAMGFCKAHNLPIIQYIRDKKY